MEQGTQRGREADGTPSRQRHRAAGAGMDEGGDAGDGNERELHHERRPVATTTANAGHATAANRRAASRGASVEMPRRTGTKPATTTWPPTHTVAAST